MPTIAELTEAINKSATFEGIKTNKETGVETATFKLKGSDVVKMMVDAGIPEEMQKKHEEFQTTLTNAAHRFVADKMIEHKDEFTKPASSAGVLNIGRKAGVERYGITAERSNRSPQTGETVTHYGVRTTKIATGNRFDADMGNSIEADIRTKFLGLK